ncbi:MAG: BBP7 family outer membrane beta-barrel protein [Pirellulales bacterium]|nr:BBP7 family outer membrane beta-barrel protein [Pirellulales bacterium]
MTESSVPPAKPSIPRVEPTVPAAKPGMLAPEGTSALLDLDYDGFDSSCEHVSCEDSGCGAVRTFRNGCSLWMRLDYLLWWTKGSRLPPLVTTSPVGDPPGILGQANTETLFGGGLINGGASSTYRLTLGYWLDACQTRGVEFEYFDLGKSSARFTQTSSGNPVLARPYDDVVSQGPSSEVIAYPGTAVGEVDARAFSYFGALGVAYRRNWLCRRSCCGGCGDDRCGRPTCCDRRRTFRLDWTAGYRHYRLIDEVSVHEVVVSTNQGGQLPIGTMFDIRDRFHTANYFHGAELGLIGSVQRGRWSMEMLAKMALGNNRREIAIDGSSVITVPGDNPVPYDAGLLALSSNVGRYASNDIVVIPQFGIELGYQVTDGLRCYLGYDLIFWSRVAQAGDQIDLAVNPALIPPPVTPQGEIRPLFELSQADFWAQGINLGLELQF